MFHEAVKTLHDLFLDLFVCFVFRSINTSCSGIVGGSCRRAGMSAPAVHPKSPSCRIKYAESLGSLPDS